MLSRFFILFRFVFFLFSIQTDGADNGRGKIECFTNDAAEREEDCVIGEPQGRADKRHTAQGLVLFATESNGGNGHCNDGQDFQNQILCAGLFAKYGKDGNVGKDVNNSQTNRPSGVVAANFVLVDENERTNDGNDIENCARERAKQKEVDHEQSRAKELEEQDACLSLLLIGKNAGKHTEYANDLCNNFNGCHINRLRAKFWERATVTSPRSHRNIILHILMVVKKNEDFSKRKKEPFRCWAVPYVFIVRYMSFVLLGKWPK